MANSFTYYFEDKILDLLFGKIDYIIPDNLYLGLSMTSITKEGLNITEPSAEEYNRKVIINSTDFFNNAINGSKSNKIGVEFPTAQSAWGEVKDFFVSDSLVEGNILFYGSLSNSRLVIVNDTLAFAPTMLEIRLI